MRTTSIPSTPLARLAAAAIAALAATAHAQSVPPATSQQLDQLQQRQQEQIQRDLDKARREVRPGGADLRAVPAQVAPPSAAAGACHDIQRIEIRNGPHLRDAIRAEITRRFAGHCLGVSEVTEILGLVTKDYIEQGFITTRAYLPAQDLRQGTLLIDVVEGRIEQFRIEDGGKGSVPISGAFPGLQGQVLNLRDLEQGIDQLNRMQSNNAKLAVEPGAAPGGSTVVIRNEASRPVHLLLSADNQGQDGTGTNQGSATLTLDNLAGLGELLSFTHRESLPLSNRAHHTRSQGMDLSVPHGYDTWSLGYIHSDYTNLLTLPSGTQLPAEGNNQIGSLGWNRVAYRDEANRLSVGASVTTKDARNFFAGQFLSVSSRRLTLLDLKTSWSRVLQGGGLLQAGLNYTRGLSELGALRDPQLLPDDQPHAQFGKFTLDTSLRLPFEATGRRWSWDSQLTAQKAEDTLYGSEKILIGSLYSVRGFYNNSLSGDDGWYWRNSLSTTEQFTLGGDALSARFYAAVDVGWVRNFNPDLPGGQLTGAAAGVQASWRNWTLDVFRTTPLSHPNTLARDPSQTWVRLSAAI